MSDNHKDEEARSNEDSRSDVSEHRGGDEYKVGRNRPPLHSRFKKGTSGNPRGRPRRAPLDVTRQVHEAFAGEILVQEGGKKKSVPIYIAFVKKYIALALNGDHKAAAIVLNLARDYGISNLKEVPELDPSVLTPEENAICSEAFALLRKAQVLK